VFAVYARILAMQAFLAKVNLMFHADIRGFTIRVIDARSHVFSFRC
jgi:hypothetical protein